jgi:Domain of unknown function (DUF4294)
MATIFRWIFLVGAIVLAMPFKGVAQRAVITPPPLSVNEKTQATLINGDTVALYNLNTVYVLAQREFRSPEEAIKYYTLCRDVKIAYPYAIMAEATFRQCEETMQSMTSESEKRRYLKEMESKMMGQYKEDLKNLTINQGRILIKLINRETGTTSYEMVKDLRGSLSAFMWQTVARLFGNSLKDTYDPETEDKEIENIIQMIEMGTI